LIENVFYTRLAAALAFPCSLFLKSQPPELAPVEDSVVGAVMSLSCKDIEKCMHSKTSKYTEIYKESLVVKCL
jgi:hypothetical protein